MVASVRMAEPNSRGRLPMRSETAAVENSSTVAIDSVQTLLLLYECDFLEPNRRIAAVVLDGNIPSIRPRAALGLVLPFLCWNGRDSIVIGHGDAVQPYNRPLAPHRDLKRVPFASRLVWACFGLRHRVENAAAMVI